MNRARRPIPVAAAGRAAGPCLALFLVVSPGAAGAQPAEEGMERFHLQATVEAVPAEPAWLSFGVVAGATQMDANLADYQWDMGPRPAWGAEALAGRGRFALGLRLWRTAAAQRLGVAGAPADAEVQGTSLELVGMGRLVWVNGNEVTAGVSAGRIRLAYEPDRIEVGGSGGAPTAVDLRPIDEWIAGASLGLRRRLAGRWSAAFEVERRRFALDTAHRDGDVIETSRESFGDWSARFGISRRFGHP